jgi:endogenous inhibitor of DNA gyrase (YacG/DUF329 family)
MNFGKLYAMVDCDVADAIKESIRQHLIEHHEVEHKHKFVAGGKESWTHLGINYYKTDDPYKPENVAEVDDEYIYPCIKCGKMRTKSEGGDTFPLCDTCWEFQTAKRHEQCRCKHNHPLRGWSSLNGIRKEWSFCPVCGKPIAGRSTHEV